MINDEECTRRLNETEVTGKKDYYFFKLGNDLVSGRLVAERGPGYVCAPGGRWRLLGLLLTRCSCAY